MLTESTPHDATTHGGLFARAGLQLRQFLCGLHGHDALLHFEQGRISLLCTSCGYESPGWDVKAAPARRDRHFTAVRLPFLRHRRAA
jgi:hypothetical protein